MAMKIIPLLKNDKKYSCYSYLILGDWNRIEDINTIIDPGIDDFVINEIERLSTGFGKVPVAQIILTHNHFDHAQSVQTIKARYHARVLAYSDGPGVDELLTDGQIVNAGDDILEVEKALFSGDTQLSITNHEESYAPEYTEALIKIACRDVQRIYSGHDVPMKSGCQEMIFKTLGNVKSCGHIL
jgi:glyoxylase-like metal-dependent hydrolase (beta-lactamase superfamily II)